MTARPGDLATGTAAGTTGMVGTRIAWATWESPCRTGSVFPRPRAVLLVGGNAFPDVDWQWIWPPLPVSAGVVGLRPGRSPARRRRPAAGR